MAVRKNNPLVTVTLLAVAAFVSLAVGLRLLTVSGDMFGPGQTASGTRFVASMTIGGGIVVFLLGTAALLAARRAVATGPQAETLPEDLDLVVIRQWSRELRDIRDEMRRDPGAEADPAVPTEVQHHELEIPASWRPDGKYLIAADGRPADPLADLKRTRQHLMDAAHRVDNIVQSIDDTAAGRPVRTPADDRTRRWLRWWRFR